VPTKHSLVRILGGLAALAIVGLLVLQTPPVNRAIWPRPTSTPERFNPLAAALPEEVSQQLEPASAGHVWQYQRDWDESIVRVCLVNATPQDGVISPTLVQQLRAAVPPRGYYWTGEWKDVPGEIRGTVKICLQRAACHYGQIPFSSFCRTPA
jgi:hypothetical protein